ncbi:insulinase family protein [Candidatus Falkowbacteria bacterium]|nr:insulinase family protein [Candidatus Falkowbacteria bacterium]
MYKKFALKNGMPVILVPKKDSQSLTILVLFKVGSRYEDIKIHHGVSHFIEHLMFKGTKKYPTTLDISKTLDGIGAEYNAYTAKDHTGYYIKANAEKLELVCDVLSEMLNNSLFDADEIEKEKGVIIEEIKMYEDTPIQHAEILFEEQIFSGNNLGPCIAGTIDSIKNMNRQKIVDYMNSFYEPKNGVIVISGKIDKKAEKILNNYFTQEKKANEMFLQKFEEFKDIQNQKRVLLNYKDTKQVHLALGVPAYSYSHPDLYALYVLGAILGGNMSSRLFINVREKRGLCYYIRAQVDVYQDTGDLMIRAGLDKDKIHEAIEVIIQELKKLKDQGITADELDKAKEFLKGRMILQLEELNELAEYFGRQFILTDKLLTPEEKIEKIFAITREDVSRVASNLLKTEKLNLVMVSPFKDEKEFINILNI